MLVAPLAACLLLLVCDGSAIPDNPVPVPNGAVGQSVVEERDECRSPADVLDLRQWKLTLPVGTREKPADPEEILPPDLSDFAIPPWFQPTGDCAGVAFRAPIDAPTTSGSKYPRSELREMTPDGRDKASWSSTSGTHTMTVVEAFTSLPRGKPDLVGAQIHDAEDDVTMFRLEGSNLYVTNGDEANYKLVTDDYVLGTKFEAKFVVADGRVQAFYNGELQATIEKEFSDAYFKVGAYTQANCQRASPCVSDNYGETVVYSLSVTHT